LFTVHANVHAPPVHATPVVFGGVPHEVPHFPQLLGLVARLVSHPLALFASQSPKPGLHPITKHFPVVHAPEPFAIAQAAPQAPQLPGSLFTSTQEPPQLTSPAWQLTVQVPAEHTKPFAHTFPHAPQFDVSAAVAVHFPLQRVCPLGHWHEPP